MGYLEILATEIQNLTFIEAEKEFLKRKVLFGENQFKTLKLMTSDGIYTNLGLMLSDQCIHSIKIAVFEGINKSVFKDRREFTGSLLKQMNDAYEFIDMYNANRSEISGLYREDKRDYPIDAIREALLNTLVHRDYSYRGSTLISIFDDHIEFVSIGGLVKGISFEDIMLGISLARNENLANIFYRLSLIEAYGTGIPKILLAYQKERVKPKIETTDNAFKITLPNLNYKGVFVLYKKIFTNPISNKKWSIEIDGQTIRTCLNNGKIKEITFDNDYKLKSKVSSEMMGKMCKGFSYHNKDAKFGEVKCYQFVGRDFNGFMPIATSTEYEDFFVTRIIGDFEDEILYHFDEDGNILEKISLGAKRMTYNQVLCANRTILMNNSYLIEQFFLENKDIKPFANKKDSFKSMLDAKSELALWYTGEEIVVFDFKNNKQIWREEINCEETGKSFKSHYCEALISPQQTKVAYRISEKGYIIVDLKSYEKVVIENSDWHPFFSPDDKYFSVGGKVYICQTGEETSNPFPFDIKQGLTYFDTFEVKIRENLIAIQQERGNSPIEIWDYHSRQMLAKIEDEFIVKHASFDFTKSSLVVHTDYGTVSVYNCKE